MARPRKPAPEPPPPALDPAALDALIGDARTADDVDALFRQMKKALMERILGAELTHHLGYAPGEPKPAAQPNHRNGTTPKTVVTEDGALPLAIPRDRAGTVAPQLVPKGVRRLPRFDQNVLSLYARGMSVREIREHLEELYQVEVAPDLISTVTSEVLEEITAWQQRPLDSCYPVVFSLTPSGSRSGTRAWSAPRPSTWPSASPGAGPRTCWASGSSRPRAPSSGTG
jgi:transposase-like protein